MLKKKTVVLPVHYSKITKEDIANLKKILDNKVDVLKQFFEVWDNCLKNVRQNIAVLKVGSRDWEGAFEDVRKQIYEIMVIKRDGGKAITNGFTKSGYGKYVGIIRRVYLYNVSISVAETNETQYLHKAYHSAVNSFTVDRPTEQQVLFELEAVYKTVNDAAQSRSRIKMIFDYMQDNSIRKIADVTDDIKEELNEQSTNKNLMEIKDSEISEALAYVEKAQQSDGTYYTLPMWNDCETDDATTEQIFNSVLYTIADLLANPKAVVHLNKDIESASVMRRIQAEITAYHNRQELAKEQA